MNLSMNVCDQQQSDSYYSTFTKQFIYARICAHAHTNAQSDGFGVISTT